MSEILGINTREVFDYRLSTVTPQIYQDNIPGGVDGPTWIIHLYSKATGELLESHDTGIPREKGDGHNRDKIKVCFEWIKSVRDKYSLPDIGKLKPKVAIIRELNDALHLLLAGQSQADGDIITAQFKRDLRVLDGKQTEFDRLVGVSSKEASE